MNSVPLPPVSEMTLESKVAFLRQPTSFPEATYRVEAIETHMSWIFLTDGYAYKLKKPVRYDFLDFSTLDARHYFCEEEVRLNRRLSNDVYLGVVPLAFNAAGHLQLDGDGKVIDWLVKMRRLQIRCMLDYATRHGMASETDIQNLALRLTDFYRACAPVSIDPAEYRNRFRIRIDAHQQELSRPDYQLPGDQIDRVCEMQHHVLQNMASLFDERVQAKKIIEGHGDLRPEHISLKPGFDIIDCLEFSRDLRVADAVDELAFLALELERLGAAAFGALLLRTYSEASNDWPGATLIHFYQSYRASLRATIAIRHLDEEKFRYSPVWPRRAREYLQLAERHAACCR